MTTPPRPGKPSAPPAAAPRHVYGPRVIGSVLPAVTRQVYRSQGAALGHLVADWPAIIGAKLAAATIPRRLAAGTLTLGCTGPVALELQHLAGPLMERINAHMGRATVQRLRFMQEVLPPSRTAPQQAAPRPAGPPVAVEGVPDGPLRDALAALGAAVGAAVRSERA